VTDDAATDIDAVPASSPDDPREPEPRPLMSLEETQAANAQNLLLATQPFLEAFLAVGLGALNGGGRPLTPQAAGPETGEGEGEGIGMKCVVVVRLDVLSISLARGAIPWAETASTREGGGREILWL